ncbi:MAG: polysaccharide biosynthesis C-terminal domain-containing protein, partial [Pseudomonadota bacterium]
ATSPGLLILLAPEPVMSIFGAEFIGAAPVLIILVLGQFANAAFGSVGLCLTMTGNGKDAAIASFFSLSVLTLCAIFLIPAHGGTGAAMATAAGLISNRLVGAIFLYRSFGFALFPSWVRA